MNYTIATLNSVEGLRYFIDSPKSGQPVNPAQLKISGWAWCETGTTPQVLVQSASGIRRLDLDLPRADVSRHLKERLGVDTASDQHGFSTTVRFEDGMKIGFDIGQGPVWVTRIGTTSKRIFPEYPTLEALTRSPEGACGNVYFHNAEDWSKVVILFNGALTEAKIAAERAPFQRWSWAKRFRHPVFCIADPLTLGQDRLLLGWYLGDSGPNSLPQTLMPVLERIKQINRDAEIIGFGSSGGGFAAIGATLLGCIDRAIAINPQTDALRFHVRSAVEAFQTRRHGTPCQSDLTAYNPDGMRRNASVTYLQNLHDLHHFEEHYLPFRACAERSGRAEAFRFVEYQDAKAGHMPPDIEQLRELLGDAFAPLLKH